MLKNEFKSILSAASSELFKLQTKIFPRRHHKYKCVYTNVNNVDGNSDLIKIEGVRAGNQLFCTGLSMELERICSGSFKYKEE